MRMWTRTLSDFISKIKNQKLIFCPSRGPQKVRMRIWFYETGWGARKNGGKEMIVIYMNSATKFWMRKPTTTDDNWGSRADQDCEISRLFYFSFIKQTISFLFRIRVLASLLPRILSSCSKSNLNAEVTINAGKAVFTCYTKRLHRRTKGRLWN